MNEVLAIEVGRRVRHYGAYNHTRNGLIVAVHGQPVVAADRVVGPMTIVNPNACRFEIVTFDGHRYDSRESCIGKPGIGRIDLLDRVHGPAMIERAHRLVAERVAAEAIAKAKADQDHAEAIERVKADNPHLIPADRKYAGAAHAAKNIRIELKKAGIKAESVRSRTFSGGDSIDVRLPHDASDDVLVAAKAIAGKYQAGHFNGMEDIYEYSRSAWTEVFGDAKYVDVCRAWAPEGGAA